MFKYANAMQFKRAMEVNALVYIPYHITPTIQCKEFLGSQTKMFNG